MEHAFLEYEEHPDKFIPTPHAITEDNMNNTPPELDIIDDRYSFLIPSENTDNTYDLNRRLKNIKTQLHRQCSNKTQHINQY